MKLWRRVRNWFVNYCAAVKASRIMRRAERRERKRYARTRYINWMEGDK